MARTKKTAEAEVAQVTETEQVAETAAEEKTQFTFTAAPAELQYDFKTRNKVAKFRKVSYEQWKADMLKCGLYLSEKKMKSAYDAIKLPKRATAGSAGYDFFSPIPFALSNMTVNPRGITFPTGIQCELHPDFCLIMIPKSGLGIRQYSRLGNCIGLIDRDYIFSDNEGDIFVNIRSDIPGNPPVEIKAGQAICQGVILPFGTTDDDETTEARNGGLGSTGK